MESQQQHRVGVVDDDGFYARALCRQLIAALGDAVTVDILNPRQPAEQWPPINAALVDVNLGDIDSSTIVRRLSQRHPRPLVVAMSACATRPEVFQMAVAGADAFWEKGAVGGVVTLLETHMSAAYPGDAFLEHGLLRLLGRDDLFTIQSHLRDKLVHLAMSLCHGNRTHAARLLGVSRQAVQAELRRPVR